MSRAFPKINTVALTIAMALPLIAVQVQAQTQERTVFRCVNAAGVVVFSDTECVVGKAAKLNLKSPSEEDLARSKAEHDAKTARDTNFANQVQANRIANEQAARSAQDQQAQANKAVADKFEQERNQKNASVVSAPNVSQPVPFTSP